ncbi:MAG TPA: carbon monoxide dehydrogenase subunit G [Egicoccus sp.]|nr:carbon monoxide dehydrogenase subunit G [Egicoccus sp.]HSK23621.1 carbon monoxide dehydrogenase subunit G [Egicoccus sp.]
MKVSGTHNVAASRQQVWDALQDPGVLARTIPGCETLEVTGEDAYAATITAGVASVKGTYQGQVRLTDKSAPTGYRLHAEGAGAPGTIRAEAVIRLDQVDADTTCVVYEADAVIGGMIGGVGQRMIAGVAKKTAGDFFAAIERELLGGPVVSTPAVTAAAPAAAAEVGRVFSGAPVSVAAPRDAGRLVGLLAAFGLGALVALAGVLVGRRMRP